MRLALLFLRIGVMNEMQYRANFFIQLVQSRGGHRRRVSWCSRWSTRTRRTCTAGPIRSCIAVMGVFTMMLGIIGFVVEPNMARLNDDVRQGTLDLILTKPADAQLLVSVREFRVWSLTDVLVGTVVLVYGADPAAARASARAAWAGFVVTLVAGHDHDLLLLAAAHAGVFWFVRMEMVQEMFTGLSRAGQYPVGIYPGWLRYGLTYVAPLAFAITVPVEALTGRLTWVRLATTLGFLVVLATVTRLVWRAGDPPLLGRLGVGRRQSAHEDARQHGQLVTLAGEERARLASGGHGRAESVEVGPGDVAGGAVGRRRVEVPAAVEEGRQPAEVGWRAADRHDDPVVLAHERAPVAVEEVGDAVAERLTGGRSPSTSTMAAATLSAAMAASGRELSTWRTSSTATPSTWRISLTRRSTRPRSGRLTVSSSIALPPPRSRMSMPITSPCTAPMRLATCPSAPGRSGSHTRTTYVSTAARLRSRCCRGRHHCVTGV